MRQKRLVSAALLGLCLFAPSARGGDETKPPFSVRDTNAAKYALDAARGLLQAGETARGMAEVQRILDTYPDDLVRIAEEPVQRWISASEAALRVLEGAPPAQRKVYEEIAAPAGTSLLGRAEALRDEALLSAVVTRYGACSVGLLAARRLADSALEAGRPRDAAAAALRGLRFSPGDAGLWLRRIDALELAGDAEALEAIERQGLPPGLGAAATAAGPVRVAERLAAARARTKPAPRGADWPQWGGGPAHDGLLSAEHRLRPLRWAGGELLRQRSNDDGPYLGQRDDSQKRFFERREMASPFFPALADRMLFVADGVTVEALDLYTGRRAWVYPGEGRPPADFPLVGESGYGMLRGRTNLDAAYAPAVSGGLVYATVEVEAPYTPRQLNLIEITTYRPRRDLVALDAKTGALRWHMGQAPEDRAALEGMSIAGPVVVAEGVVAAVGVRHDNRWSVSLLAFDATSGRLRWSRHVVVGQQELNLFGQPVKELYAGVPAVADGVVYAPTGLGVFAAADLRSGELLWMSSYDAAEIERVDVWYATPLRFSAWGPAPPVVHGDAVVFAPADSPWLSCLDRKDGRLRWREHAEGNPRKDAWVDQFLGVADDGRRTVALATGKGLRALDLSTGNRAWKADLMDEDDTTRGRGAVTADTVYVPTDKGLSRFQVRGEGKFLGAEAWPPGAEPGNVLPFPEVLVVAGRGGLDRGHHGAIQGFFAWEDLEKALAARRAARPADPAIALEAADLWRVVGDYGRAEDLYREALRLSEAAADAAAMGRARHGLHLVAVARGDVQAEAKRPADAKASYEAALAFSDAPPDRVAVRLRLDGVLEALSDTAGRIASLEALAKEAGEERATFDASGEVLARAGARLRIAAIERAAGHPQKAVDALQAILEADGEAALGEETARARVKREVDAIVAEAGPAAYARYEGEARARLEEAGRLADAALYEQILARYPNAAAVPGALLGLAARQAAAGEPAKATSTLRRLISAYPDHALVAQGLALLARTLSSLGSREAARAALSTLERRHADATFALDGTPWTGRSFAEAERQRLGTPPLAPPEAPLSPPLKEALMHEVESGRPGAHIVPVANARSGPAPAPVLVNTGSEVIAIDPALSRLRFHAPIEGVTQAAMVGDVLVLAGVDVLEALDPATGEVRWVREVRGVARALDAGQGQVLALVQEPGVLLKSRLVAVDAFTSEVLWSREMPNEAADTLLVGEEVAAVVRKRRTERGYSVSVAVYALLSGALVKEIPLSGETYLEPIVRLADPKTIIAGVREAGATRVDAWDLPGAVRRWSRPLPDAQGRVSHLLPAGDSVVALDGSGVVRTLSLADGTVLHETKITGGAEVLAGTQPFLDGARLTLVQREGSLAALSSFDRATGRAAWTLPVPLRVNAGLLLRSGDVFVLLLSPRGTGGRAPGSLRVQLVDAKEGKDLGTIQNGGLAAWQPSAVVEDGALVIAGQESIGVYR